jgi:N6-L-threonylcarbamoyladenine synthase
MRILAFESSCDETAIALLEAKGKILNLLVNRIYSQIAIHKKYGGVVPEVAARKHLETIIPLLDDILGKNKLGGIDYLAVTSGPGLITSLLLGTTVAKTLAYANNLPLLPLNHIEGHIYSNWLSNPKLIKDSRKYFPALVLVVSGGHTELILMKNHGVYKLIGQTLDDAVGEAFDKVAKLLSLGYPGGPIVSQQAKAGKDNAYDFPRPLLKEKNYDFSLAGLKTAVLYTLEKKKKITKQDKADICASFQKAVVDVLTKKTRRAAEELNVKAIMLAGGVAANQSLRAGLAQVSRDLNLPFFSPTLELAGDNAAMMATAAYYRLASRTAEILKGRDVLSLEPRANWQLSKK